VSFRSMLCAFALFAVPSVPHLWHNHLKKSAPAPDEALSPAPTQIRLWFAEAVQPELTTIGLTQADGGTLRMSKVRKTDDPLSVVADIEDRLGPGVYKVGWRTAGDDVHQVKGTFKFTVH